MSIQREVCPQSFPQRFSVPYFVAFFGFSALLQDQKLHVKKENCEDSSPTAQFGILEGYIQPVLALSVSIATASHCAGSGRRWSVSGLGVCGEARLILDGWMR